MAKYKINIISAANGVLSVDHSGLDDQWCENGDNVVVDNMPSAGWGLRRLWYTKTDGTSPVNIIGNEFTMPAYDINILAEFRRFDSQDWTPEGKAAVKLTDSALTSGTYTFVQLFGGMAPSVVDSVLAGEVGGAYSIVDDDLDVEVTGVVEDGVLSIDYRNGDDHYNISVTKSGSNYVVVASEVDDLEGAVRYDEAQTLTDEQKEQARANIGATTPMTRVTDIPSDGEYQPNTLYVVDMDDEEYSINIAEGSEGVADEYHIIMTTGETAPTITWQEGLTWVGGSAPTIAANKTYEVSICENIAIAVEV